MGSMQMDHEKWHDGIGYDVEAIAEMTGPERKRLVEVLTGVNGGVTWREVEALKAIDLPAARRAIKAASQDHLRVDTRLSAADAMLDSGKMKDKDFDALLARQIRALHRIEDGCTKALLLAEQYPTDRVKQALLWASWNHTECAMHCAAMLCYLCGVAKEPFDWAMRPFFLRLGFHENYFTRKAAFDELCKMVKMELDTSQE